MDKEKIAEAIMMSLGLFLFVGEIAFLIYSTLIYYYPNYPNNVIIELILEDVAVAVVLFVYCKEIKKLNKEKRPSFN